MKKRMKKSVKGFTLVEIIVAMAILALASLVLALMYASIANSMNMTNDIHDRMSEQQKYVELYEADKQAAGGAGGSGGTGGTGGTGGSGSGAADPIADSKDGKKLNIYCTHNAANKSWVGASAANSKNFVVNCTVYELYNFEDGRPVPKSQDDDDLTVNLKYFVGDNSLE